MYYPITPLRDPLETFRTQLQIYKQKPSDNEKLNTLIKQIEFLKKNLNDKKEWFNQYVIEFTIKAIKPNGKTNKEISDTCQRIRNLQFVREGVRKSRRSAQLQKEIKELQQSGSYRPKESNLGRQWKRWADQGVENHVGCLLRQLSTAAYPLNKLSRTKIDKAKIFSTL